MKHGIQTALALAAQITPQTVHGLISSADTRHSSFVVALRLARITSTLPELWLRGGPGTPETRRAAIRAWAEREGPKNVSM